MDEAQRVEFMRLLDYHTEMIKRELDDMQGLRWSNRDGRIRAIGDIEKAAHTALYELLVCAKGDANAS